MAGFSWNDGITSSATFGYDAASRLTEIDNANAHISRSYYNDGLLRVEHIEDANGNPLGQMYYTYDENGNRASSAVWPGGASLNYLYTNRNQVKWINDDATGAHQAYYEYNTNGYVTLRNAYTSPVTASNYSYDGHDRVTWVTHTLNGTTRNFNYGYNDDSNDLKFVRRLGTGAGNVGDVFRYDDADQAISFQLDVSNPDQVGSLPQRVFYDPNGNRTTFTAADQYDPANNLNQYTNRTLNNHTSSADYDITGNLSTSPESTPLTCTYDAQNRLTQASKNGVTMTFKYDGLNRQVRRTVGGVTTYSTWDGWSLVEEYTNSPGLAIQARYLYGPTGLVKNLTANRYYYQDGSGSTSHLADSGGHLLEWYRYDLQGASFFYDANNNQLSTTNYSVRHLLTGQQWYSQIGLYDLRNRFYSPDLGRFLQPDPAGFNGDATNLYRYCGNNPVAFSDPTGLDLTITLYPASFHGLPYNHVGIGVNTTITQGYYPRNGNGKHKGPGDVFFDRDFNYPYEISSITIQTNEKQDQAVLEYIAQVRDHPGTFTFWYNNCARFVEGALDAAGIKNVSRTRQPNHLMNELQNRLSRREIRRRMEGRSPSRENRVGPVGFMPWGNPFGPGGFGPGPGPGPVDSGPSSGPIAPPDSGPTTGPDSPPYVPGPIEPFWQDPNDVPDFNPFPESPYDNVYDSDIGSGLKND